MSCYTCAVLSLEEKKSLKISDETYHSKGKYKYIISKYVIEIHSDVLYLLFFVSM